MRLIRRSQARLIHHATWYPWKPFIARRNDYFWRRRTIHMLLCSISSIYSFSRRNRLWDDLECCIIRTLMTSLRPASHSHAKSSNDDCYSIWKTAIAAETCLCSFICHLGSSERLNIITSVHSRHSRCQKPHTPLQHWSIACPNEHAKYKKGSFEEKSFF